MATTTQTKQTGWVMRQRGTRWTLSHKGARLTSWPMEYREKDLDALKHALETYAYRGPLTKQDVIACQQPIYKNYTHVPVTYPEKTLWYVAPDRKGFDALHASFTVWQMSGKWRDAIGSTWRPQPDGVWTSSGDRATER